MESKPKKQISKLGKEFVTLSDRQQALGIKVKCLDATIKKLIQNAEILFEPKKIETNSDWLHCHSEAGQTFEQYLNCGKNTITKQRNKIYINILDANIDPEFIASLKSYCEAFYYSMKVEVLLDKDSKIMKLIPNRINDFTDEIQFDAGAILSKTIPQQLPLTFSLVPKDAYCMISVTLQDLYPRPSWNFVFGLANLRERTGVFSFKRYDPAFQGIQDPNREKTILKNSCAVMVHEVGHKFGLKHCIYYECKMNGSNSYQESCRKNRCKKFFQFSDLCPVCIRKLESVIGFDVKERNLALQKVSEQLGFEDSAEYYKKLNEALI